ncbi:Calcium/calmodulin-dependent 3',5'-cyclic nucleotide phosphodiesterase 1C, partial [Sarracenia purpurea var. burkii]
MSTVFRVVAALAPNGTYLGKHTRTRTVGTDPVPGSGSAKVNRCALTTTNTHYEYLGLGLYPLRFQEALTYARRTVPHFQISVASPPDKSADQKHLEASAATADTPAAVTAAAASATTVTTATSMTSTAAAVATVERFKYSGQSASISAPSNETQTMGAHNGQLSKQGSLTIVRRSSTKKSPPSGKYFRRGTSVTIADDDALDEIDLNTENLPAVDTPDACDKAALSELRASSFVKVGIIDILLRPCAVRPPATASSSSPSRRRVGFFSATARRGDAMSTSKNRTYLPISSENINRLRCLLRQLQKGEISAELLQKNLRYAAKVLEAVFVDET